MNNIIEAKCANAKCGKTFLKYAHGHTTCRKRVRTCNTKTCCHLCSVVYNRNVADERLIILRRKFKLEKQGEK